MRQLRVGFLGVGWIGRHRMAAMLATGLIKAAAICDPSLEMCQDARALAPGAEVVTSLDVMLGLGLDGIIIATPSALHAAQAIRCLEAGVAVFCQKPLGRNAHEVARVVDAAHHADRLLMTDFSYRHTRAMREIARLIHTGALGHVFAIDLVFHNAYGPDKPWFYDRSEAGGGCVVDLGSHLVDLAYWTLRTEALATDVSTTLFHEGKRLQIIDAEVEDYAISSFMLGDVAVRLACSWRLHAGREAVIQAAFYGTKAGASLRNVAGSFYDFEADLFTGTTRELLVGPPDEWGARAAEAWVTRATQSLSFSTDAEGYVVVAKTLDRIYESV